MWELGNENIDVINYTSNTSLFISRALSPVTSSITIDEDNSRAEVFKARPSLFSYRRGGTNIRCGSISGYENDARDVDDTEDVH